jgi:acetoin utilization deacetylase AcuC-like enzyme
VSLEGFAPFRTAKLTDLARSNSYYTESLGSKCKF